MNVIFVSSRGRGTEQNRTGGDTVHISVPCELVIGLLAQGAILQMQIGPAPLMPDLARPAPRPDCANTRPDTANTNTRSDTANTNTRQDAANANPRTDSGRSQATLNRPERPSSRCPPARPISPYTDWSSLPDLAEVISIYSDNSNNNYVTRSPAYEPDSPGPNPVEESEDWDPTPVEEAPEGQHAEPSRTVFFLTFLLTLETMLEPGFKCKAMNSSRKSNSYTESFPFSQGYRTEKEEFRQKKAYVKYDYL